VRNGIDLATREKRFLTRRRLDRAAPNNPVCLPIGHFTLVNSEALALAGINEGYARPGRWIIHRDKTTGEPNGTLEEAAEDLVHIFSRTGRTTNGTSS